MSSFALTPCSPLKLLDRADLSAFGVFVSQRSAASVCQVLARRGSEMRLAERVRQRFGLDLPRSPRFAASGNLALVWAGPSQWLAVGDHVAGGADLAAVLESSLADAASIVDQSGGRVIFRVGGPKVRDALAKGVHLDLHPRAFGPGSTAITSIAHIGVHFWQLDANPTYEFTVFRSFAGAFYEWLEDAVLSSASS